MSTQTRLCHALFAAISFLAFGFPPDAFAQSRIRFVDSGQRLGTNDRSTDAALGDVDGDGDLDAIVTTFGALQRTSRVYENDGAGRFTNTGVRVGSVASMGHTTAVALGDLDGDGDLDAFVARGDASNEVWLNTTPPPVPTFPEYVITTIAGNGANGSTGNGGQATNASLANPRHLAVDAQGNIYISGGDHRVRKVATNGIITTLAGTGITGFSGDGGPATNAQWNDTAGSFVGGGVAVDRAGNLYIADTGNGLIRRVDTNGTITTFAGPGTFFEFGDGSPATEAWLHEPRGVAVDASDNVFLATGDRVRRLTPNGSNLPYAPRVHVTPSLLDFGPVTTTSVPAPPFLGEHRQGRHHRPRHQFDRLCRIRHDQCGPVEISSSFFSSQDS